MNHVRKINRNILFARLLPWRKPQDEIISQAVDEVFGERPGQCRLCEARADVQLVATIVRKGTKHTRAEYLCFDHIGPFVQTWGNPAVAEWTVVPIR